MTRKGRSSAPDAPMDALSRTNTNDLDSSSGGAHCRWRSTLGDTPVQRHRATGMRIPRKGLRKAAVPPSTPESCSPATFSEAMSARGSVKKFIDAPEGRNALGMIFDRRHNLLFVAGGLLVRDMCTTRGPATLSRPISSAARRLRSSIARHADRSWRLVHRLSEAGALLRAAREARHAGTFTTLQLTGPARPDQQAVQPQRHPRSLPRASLDRRPLGATRRASTARGSQIPARSAGHCGHPACRTLTVIVLSGRTSCGRCRTANRPDHSRIRLNRRT